MTLLTLALGLTLLGYVVWLGRFHPVGMIGVMLGLVVARAAAGSFVGVSMLSMQVYPEDLLFAGLAIAAALRFAVTRPPSSSRWLLLFGLITLVATGLGIFRFGFNLAGGDARLYVHLIALALFTSTIDVRDPATLRCLLRLWLGCAFVLVCVALFFWARDGIGTATGQARVRPASWLFNGGIWDDRPLRAPEALFMVQAGGILWLAKDQLRLPAFVRSLGIATLLCSSVLLQHRTVWVAAVAALGVTLLWKDSNRQRTSSRRVVMGLGMLAGAGAFLVLLSSRSTVRDSLTSSTSTALSEGSTFTWRLKSWSALLEQVQGLSILSGTPFGAGYERRVQLGIGTTTEITVSPHNFYVQTLVRLGVIGLICLVAIGVSIVRAQRRHRHDLSVLVIFLMTSLAAFCASYAPTYEQGLVVGLAIGLIGAVRPAKGPPEQEGSHAPRRVHHLAQSR